jgi:YD repeat-containing protein
MKRLALALLSFAIPTLIASTGAVAATTYTYDALGRVTAVQYDNGIAIAYQYDAAGNRTAVTTGP